MPYELTYVRLLVPNFAACFRFYRDVLGFAPTFGSEGDVYADFAAGSVTLALFDQGAMSAALGTTDLPARPPSQDAVCLVLAVPDVDAAYAALEAQGVSAVQPPMDRPVWGLRTAHVRDPAGNLIELYTPLPTS